MNHTNNQLLFLIYFSFYALQDIMGSTSDVHMPPSAEDLETTIEIKIKTLDSQTYNLRVNKCVS